MPTDWIETTMEKTDKGLAIKIPAGIARANEGIQTKIENGKPFVRAVAPVEDDNDD